MKYAGHPCGYCGRLLDGFTGELHVTMLKVSRLSDNVETRFGMGESYFCDSGCLCNAIKEIEMIGEHDAAYSE